MLCSLAEKNVSSDFVQNHCIYEFIEFIVFMNLFMNHCIYS